MAKRKKRTKTILQQLSHKEQRILFLCMRATTQGDFFRDGLFQTLSGIQLEEVLSVAADWPHIDEDCPVVRSALGCIWHLMCATPKKKYHEEISTFIPEAKDRKMIKQVARKISDLLRKHRKRSESLHYRESLLQSTDWIDETSSLEP